MCTGQANVEAVSRLEAEYVASHRQAHSDNDGSGAISNREDRSSKDFDLMVGRMVGATFEDEAR